MPDENNLILVAPISFIWGCQIIVKQALFAMSPTKLSLIRACEIKGSENCQYREQGKYNSISFF